MRMDCSRMEGRHLVAHGVRASQLRLTRAVENGHQPWASSLPRVESSAAPSSSSSTPIRFLPFRSRRRIRLSRPTACIRRPPARSPSARRSPAPPCQQLVAGRNQKSWFDRARPRKTISRSRVIGGGWNRKRAELANLDRTKVYTTKI